jgi:hypothetical protein
VDLPKACAGREAEYLYADFSCPASFNIFAAENIRHALLASAKFS